MNKKAYVLIGVVAIIVITVFLMSQRPLLFNNGKSQYAIVLCEDASISERTAAEELQDYLKQISGAELPLISINDLSDKRKHIFVGFNNDYAVKCGVKVPEDSDEGYTYRTIGEKIEELCMAFTHSSKMSLA